MLRITSGRQELVIWREELERGIIDPLTTKSDLVFRTLEPSMVSLA